VIGVDGVGLTAAATLRALGHESICAVDTSAAELAAAQALGASVTVTADAEDPSGKVLAAARPRQRRGRLRRHRPDRLGGVRHAGDRARDRNPMSR
jgi:Zn-dependent alcohol dehydrogenase